jgi:hypothetical protein
MFVILCHYMANDNPGPARYHTMRESMGGARKSARGRTGRRAASRSELRLGEAGYLLATVKYS